MGATKKDLDDLTGEAGTLASDISGIVVSMQFQDIVRQRIEHVIGPLLELKAEIEQAVNETRSIANLASGLSSDNSTGWLEQHYTMDSERKILQKTIDNGEGDRDKQDNNDSKIDIFDNGSLPKDKI